MAIVYNHYMRQKVLSMQSLENRRLMMLIVYAFTGC